MRASRALDSKYFYNFWRPITAIRAGEDDGNPNRRRPNVDAARYHAQPSDYPSGHSCYGGAASKVLASALGDEASARSV